MHHQNVAKVTRGVSDGAEWFPKRPGANLVGMTRLAKPKPPLTRRQPRGTRAAYWPLQDAKARFSELVRRVKDEGPQHVTVHGREEVVVIAADEFRRLKGDRSGEALVAAMQASPHRGVKLEPTRTRSHVRDVDL